MAELLGHGEVLSGQTEQDYWSKNRKDRQDKLEGKVKTKGKDKKERGKFRVIKKVHEMQQNENAHKYFNDDDEN